MRMTLPYATLYSQTRLTLNRPVMTLYEEPHMRYMCPVTWFLSLAFADGVFQDMESSKDLETVKPIPGNSLYRAKYKPEVLERPVMRGMRADKSMSETRIWTYDCFNFALKVAGQRAGYQENLSAYCFRRAFAHAVEGKLITRGCETKLTYAQVKPQPLSEGH